MTSSDRPSHVVILPYFCASQVSRYLLLAQVLEEFGPQRVVSTPISESTIMGAGLGAALVGTRPIIEMRIFDFVMCAMDELVNQIAKIRYMFGGQAKPAVVVRMPHGIWRNSAAQHSQTLESWFTHIPGVVPCCCESWVGSVA